MPDASEETAGGPWARFVRWARSRRFRVADRSMEPTLVPGDCLYVDRGAYRERTPARGDLVVAREPDPPHRFFVKRVGLVGGDLLPPGTLERTATTTVPRGFVFLLGDNPRMSDDSRRFGPVPVGSLVGRAYRCYRPPERRRDF